MDLLNEIKRLLPGFEIERITASNYKRFEHIYISNDDYFLLTEGQVGSVENCLKDINSVPPGFDVVNKLFAAFFIDGEAVAVMDALIGYPSSDTVWIGFLLIHGEWKRKGIGKRIIEALFEASRALGLHKFQLGVIENNLTGLAIWQKMGFEKIRESKTEMPGGKEVNIIVMEMRRILCSV